MKQMTGGVLIPVCSPCDEEGRFLPKEFEVLMRNHAKTSLDGFYVCGGTGEGNLMRLEERKLACEIAVEIAHQADKTVLTHIGAFSRRDAVELAIHAAAAGADAISSVPLHDADHQGQMDYYRAITQGSGLPTILYYIPGSQTPLEQVLESLDVPGVAGIKSSSNDFFFTMQLMAGRPQGSILFNGKDEYLAAATAQGADGGIGMWANVFPEVYASIFRNAKEGRLTQAFETQVLLNRLCCIAFSMGLIESFESILRYQGSWDRVFRKPSPRYDQAFYERFLAQAQELIDQLTSCKKG